MRRFALLLLLALAMGGCTRSAAPAFDVCLHYQLREDAPYDEEGNVRVEAILVNRGAEPLVGGDVGLTLVTIETTTGNRTEFPLQWSGSDVGRGVVQNEYAVRVPPGDAFRLTGWMTYREHRVEASAKCAVPS